MSFWKKFTGALFGDDSAESSSSASSSSASNAGETTSAAASSFINNILPGHGPDSVVLQYNTFVFQITFSPDDFDAEEDPSSGITVRSLKFLVSRLLTPKIMADSSETSSTASAVRKLYKKKNGAGIILIDSNDLVTASGKSRPVDVNKFMLIYNGKKLEDGGKSLKAYGVKDGGKIEVFVSKPEAMYAAAAAADRQKKATSGNGKKGKKGGAKKQQQQQQQPAGFNISEIPRKFPVPTQPVALKTEREKIADVQTFINEKVVPLLDAFVANVPDDKEKRRDDHRMISETILQKMLVLDGIDTSQEDDKELEEGVLPLRQTRKEAVNKMNRYLAQADEAMKKKSQEE